MQLKYWEYFLSIESDLEQCTRFVDFSESNFHTYSVEFAKIIMASAAEIDTVSKELCKLIDPSSDKNNIIGYKDIILLKYPSLKDIEVSLPKYGIKTKPWDGWRNSPSPEWWKSYNKIKHDRTNNFEHANLINAIKSVSSLLLILMYYYKEENNGVNEQIDYSYKPRILSIVDIRPPSGLRGGNILWGYHIE